MKSLKKRVADIERTRGIGGQHVQNEDHARGDGIEKNGEVSAIVAAFLKTLRPSPEKMPPEERMEHGTGRETVVSPLMPLRDAG